MPLPELENESEISREIGESLKTAMETIYAFLAKSPWSNFFGETSIVKNNQRKTLGEIYDSKKQTE